jgi:medium-chain acyl-[acyl-carrier-protein] hydrolase
MADIFSKQYQVRFNEADFRGVLRPVALLNLMQDSADADSTRSGYSVADLKLKNMTWVLSRYHIRVDRYPAVGETIAINTWRSTCEGMYSLREFEIIDCSGTLLAAATSSWVVVDLSSKRPVRLDKVLTDLPLFNRRAINDDFVALPKMINSSREETFRVRMADLDQNRHVNHTVYVEWALESVPEAILENFSLVELEVGYRAEAFYGDTVLARAEVTQEGTSATFLHQLVNERNGREFTRLRTAWVRFQEEL